jgi:hypothetical protein
MKNQIEDNPFKTENNPKIAFDIHVIALSLDDISAQHRHLINCLIKNEHFVTLSQLVKRAHFSIFIDPNRPYIKSFENSERKIVVIGLKPQIIGRDFTKISDPNIYEKIAEADLLDRIVISTAHETAHIFNPNYDRGSTQSFKTLCEISVSKTVLNSFLPHFLLSDDTDPDLTERLIDLLEFIQNCLNSYVFNLSTHEAITEAERDEFNRQNTALYEAVQKRDDFTQTDFNTKRKYERKNHSKQTTLYITDAQRQINRPFINPLSDLTDIEADSTDFKTSHCQKCKKGFANNCLNCEAVIKYLRQHSTE